MVVAFDLLYKGEKERGSRIWFATELDKVQIFDIYLILLLLIMTAGTIMNEIGILEHFSVQ